MPQPDQPSHPTSDPAHPAAVHQVYLTTNIRSAIRVATAKQLRAALAEIARHLCYHLGDPPGLDAGQSWQGCQVGSGTRAGFQLYHHALQAVADYFLQALGLDPVRATTDNDYLASALGPFLAVSPRQSRRTLIRLVDCIDATVKDADIAAGAAGDVHAGLPEDVWEVVLGLVRERQ